MSESQRLREIRKKNGLNQKQVAEMIGVSPGAVCRWEKGDREISDWVIKAYSSVFNVSENYFRSRSQIEEMVPSHRSSDNDAYLTNQEKRLLEYFRRLGAVAKEKYVHEISRESGVVSEFDTDRGKGKTIK